MLIGIDSSPCSLSLRNRSTLCSTTRCHQNKSDLKMFLYKNLFSMSSILSIPIMLIGINGGYCPAICRVCLNIEFGWKLNKLKKTRHKKEQWSIFTIQELDCIGAMFFCELASQRLSNNSLSTVIIFLRLEEYWRSPFNQFIGVNFEAGNETREKICYFAEENEECSETKAVFYSYHCFLGSEKLRCKKFCKRAKFFVHVRHFKAIFFNFFG